MRRVLLIATGLLLGAIAVFALLWRGSGAHEVSTDEARRRFEQGSSSTQGPDAAVLRPAVGVYEYWFATKDGLPLRNRRTATVHADTTVGSSTYTEHGSFALVSLQAQR